MTAPLASMVPVADAAAWGAPLAPLADAAVWIAPAVPVADATTLLVAGWVAATVGAAVAVVIGRRERRLRRAVAQASHEVRGPLTAAQLALDGLTLRGEVDAAHTLGLELQLRRAGRALDDLAGGTAPAPDRPEPLALVALAAELEAAWRPVVAAHHRSLVVEVAGSGWVLADRVRLAQAAGNLLANALDHGVGAVRLSVSAPGSHARVAVADDGPGPRRPLAELLAPPRGSLPRRGHGLRVAAAVAARAGGCLSLSGATFALDLPQLDAALAPARACAPPESRSARVGRVLAARADRMSRTVDVDDEPAEQSPLPAEPQPQADAGDGTGGRAGSDAARAGRRAA